METTAILESRLHVAIHLASQDCLPESEEAHRMRVHIGKAPHRRIPTIIISVELDPRWIFFAADFDLLSKEVNVLETEVFHVQVSVGRVIDDDDDSSFADVRAHI